MISLKKDSILTGRKDCIRTEFEQNISYYRFWKSEILKPKCGFTQHNTQCCILEIPAQKREVFWVGGRWWLNSKSLTIYHCNALLHKTVGEIYKSGRRIEFLRSVKLRKMGGGRVLWGTLFLLSRNINGFTNFCWLFQKLQIRSWALSGFFFSFVSKWPFWGT